MKVVLKNVGGNIHKWADIKIMNFNISILIYVPR